MLDSVLGQHSYHRFLLNNDYWRFWRLLQISFINNFIKQQTNYENK